MNSKSFSVPTDDLYITPNLQPGQLPEQLQRAISVTNIPSQQDMLLLGTLTAVSYALPRVRILHGQPQHSYYPNLMSLVVAPPAAGKGVLNYTHRLMAPIQDKLRQLGMTATPRRQDNANTYRYFGEPVYSYSLKQGIADGYLTPFRVRISESNIDEYNYNPEDDIEGEIDTEKTYTEHTAVTTTITAFLIVKPFLLR